jgi:hypothetical protein
MRALSGHLHLQPHKACASELSVIERTFNISAYPVTKGEGPVTHLSPSCICLRQSVELQLQTQPLIVIFRLIGVKALFGSVVPLSSAKLFHHDLFAVRPSHTGNCATYSCRQVRQSALCLLTWSHTTGHAVVA